MPAGARISAGKFGRGGEVVPERRRFRGEPVTGQLHAVTRVTREPDDHPIETADLLAVPVPTRMAGRPLLADHSPFGPFGPVGLLGWATDLAGH
ncbi:hypothetical protein GCM10020254_37700 [Streptomyces goshikiensis]